MDKLKTNELEHTFDSDDNTIVINVFLADNKSNISQYNSDNPHHFSHTNHTFLFPLTVNARPRDTNWTELRAHTP